MLGDLAYAKKKGLAQEQALVDELRGELVPLGLQDKPSGRK